jgi:heme oxygenase
VLTNLFFVSQTVFITAMPSLLSALKQTTRPIHQRLEKKMDLFDASFSRTDYIRLLEDFWGYYRPIEPRLANNIELCARLPDVQSRAKLPWLEKDLSVLGIDGDAREQLPVCRELPPCDSLAEALGCLYVLEGASLGGQVISHHLQHALALDADNGLAFFNGYGQETRTMWQTFGECLTAAGADEIAVIHSASATFLSLERWLFRNDG